MTTPTVSAVEPLEPLADWRSRDLADGSWIRVLDGADVEELEAALAVARRRHRHVVTVTRHDFPLPTLGRRLAEVARDLVDGRGLAVLRGLPVHRCDRSDAAWILWGVGTHLGRAWPQGDDGRLLDDVTGRGGAADPASRGDLGGIAFPYHSDPADLLGLLCLDPGAEGGARTVANAVAVHNELVRIDPALAAALYEPLAYDCRGQHADGERPWATAPVFTRWGQRLFVRYARPYIRAAARHADAPRPSIDAVEAMNIVDDLCRDPDFHLWFDLEPGDLQFSCNHHLLHSRAPYWDEPAAGRVRHLKRLWLETDLLDDEDKPELFRLGGEAPPRWPGERRADGAQPRRRAG